MPNRAKSPPQKFYAHSHPDYPNEPKKRQGLEEHLVSPAAPARDSVRSPPRAEQLVAQDESPRITTSTTTFPSLANEGRGRGWVGRRR